MRKKAQQRAVERLAAKMRAEEKQKKWSKHAKRKKSSRNKHAKTRARIIRKNKRPNCAQSMKWTQNALLVHVATQELHV